MKKILYPLLTTLILFNTASFAEEAAGDKPVYVHISEMNLDTFKERVEYLPETPQPSMKYLPAFSVEDKRIIIDRNFVKALKEKKNLDEYDVNLKDLEDISKARIYLVYSVVFGGKGRYGSSTEYYISGKDTLTIIFPPKTVEGGIEYEPYLRSMVTREEIRPVEQGFSLTIQRKEEGSIDILEDGEHSKTLKADEEGVAYGIEERIKFEKKIPGYDTEDYGIVEFSAQLTVSNYGEVIVEQEEGGRL